MQDEQQRCERAIIDKTSVLAAYVVLLQSACNTGFLICSQVRHSGRSCNILHTLPQWIISLHVFEDDTVAKVTVSKANRNVFCVFVGPCPVFCCFAVLLVAKRKSGWGICGSFLVAVVVLFWFSLFFVMICLSFWTTRVLVHFCFSLLTQL